MIYRLFACLHKIITKVKSVPRHNRAHVRNAMIIRIRPLLMMTEGNRNKVNTMNSSFKFLTRSLSRSQNLNIFGHDITIYQHHRHWIYASNSIFLQFFVYTETVRLTAKKWHNHSKSIPTDSQIYVHTSYCQFSWLAFLN